MLNIIKNDIIAKAVAYTVSESIDAKLMHLLKRPYDAEFTGSNGDTVRIEVDGDVDAYVFDQEVGIIVQDYSNSSIELEVKTQIDTSIGITQKEATFDMPNFTEKMADKAGKAIAKFIERYAVENAIMSLSNFMITGDLDSSDKLIDINTFFDERNVSTVNRFVVLSTSQKAIIMKKCKDIVEEYKRGTNETITGAEIGFVWGSNYVWSNQLDQINKEVVKSTYSNTGTLAVALKGGEKEVHLKGGVADETINKFSVVKVGNVSFVVKEDVEVASDGSAVLKTDRVVGTAAVNATISYVGVVNSLVLDPNSMVLACVAPSNAVGENMAYISDATNGFGVSVQWGWDIKFKKGIVSFSTYVGFLNVNKNLNAGTVTAAADM